MKTTIVTLSLLSIGLAFAAPAAAECTTAPTGTTVCAFVEDPASQSIGVDQSGVGAVGYSYYEFSFFGTDYKGTNVYVATHEGSPAGSNYLAFNEFCMGQGGTCTNQDDTLYYSGTAGYAYVSYWQGSESDTLCVAAGDVFECTTL